MSVKKGYIVLGIAVMAVLVFCATDALAYGNPEDKVFSIMDRVLDMIASFLERIFQAIADAVRSVFTGVGDSGATEKASAAGHDVAKKAFDFYKS